MHTIPSYGIGVESTAILTIIHFTKRGDTYGS